MIKKSNKEISISTRAGAEGTTHYHYHSEGNGLNALKQVVGFNGIEENYHYDNYGRLIEKKEKIDQQEYISYYNYNQFDQLIETTYPSGFRVKNHYDAKGYLQSVTDAAGMPFYESPEKNARGQLTRYRLGNGLITEKSYDHYGRLKEAGNPTAFKQGLTYYPENGLIQYSSDGRRALYDECIYDNQQRLTQSKYFDVSSGPPHYWKAPTTISYSNNGNITQKSDVGTYAYGSQQPHAVLAMTNVNNTNIAPATQNVTYTPFDRTASISEGALNLQFTYGPSYDRKKTQLYTNGQLTRTRIYSGLYEKTTEGNTTTEVHYVAAGDGVCALHVIENGVGTTYYVYKDHLGSYRAITDGSGNLVAEQNYDAWGRERNPSDWSYTLTANKPKWLYRGYTGHEMLPEFGLVNMNNRLYDPLLGRMLAVDNFVQNPYSTQSYNRYSYVLNNPMSYVDPSGEFVNFSNFFGGKNKSSNSSKVDPTGYTTKEIQDAYIQQTQKNGVFLTSVFVGGSVAAWAPLGTTGFIGGAFTGATSGFASGFVSGFGNSLIDGNNFSTSFKSGLSSGAFGAALGGTIGGFSGGIDAVRHGRNFWTGSYKQYKINETLIASNQSFVTTDEDVYTVMNTDYKDVYYKPESGRYGFRDRIKPGYFIDREVDGIATQKFADKVFKMPDGSIAKVLPGGDVLVVNAPYAAVEAINPSSFSPIPMGWKSIDYFEFIDFVTGNNSVRDWSPLFNFARIIR